MKNESNYNQTLFTKTLDSAKFYQNISAEKTAQFVIESINNSKSVKDNANTFEVLADTYVLWKQYDLAVTNYKISLNNRYSNSVQLKLAESYCYQNEYDLSLGVYNFLKDEKLSNWDLISKKEGIADIYFKTEKIKEALALYNEALKKANKNKIRIKQINLNSKIAGVYKKMRVTDVAKNYYDIALKLAGKESKKRQIEEKIKEAEFQNKILNFDNEIKIREEIISDVELEVPNLPFTNQSPLTLQKQNYKIGNAYYLKKNMI